jgi:hypothetical protein
MNQTCLNAAARRPHQPAWRAWSVRGLSVVVPGLLLALTPQLAAKKKAEIVYDKTVDFSKYKTYAWVQGIPVIDPRIDHYITHSVDDVLGRSALTQVKVNEADLIVTYNAARDSDLSIGTVLDPTYAATGGVSPTGTSIWVTPSSGGVPTHVHKGSLNFEILDRKANKPIWTGTAKGSISDKPGDHWSQVQKALDDLFHDYPPTTTKQAGK